MTGRTHSERNSNPTFEGLFQRVGALEGLMASMNGLITNMRRNASLTMPTPTLPFKIAEEGTSQGILITVGVNLPGQDYDVIRGSLIRVFDNEIKAGETEDQASARAIQKIKKFTIKITDKDRALGVAIRQLEELPLVPKETATKNQYQLLELIAVNKDTSARATNPAQDPTKTFPFPALSVDVMGEKFFTIGDSTITDGPSQPDKSRIVENRVNLATQAADAIVTFKVFASATDPTKTFEDLDITEAYVGIRPFADADDATGETDNKFRPGGPIADRTKPFTLISQNFPLGERYKWNRVITLNAGGKKVAIAVSTIDFFAGGEPPTNGIPEIETFTLTAVQRNNTHTLLTALIKQYANGQPLSPPPTPRQFAALLKRLTFTMQEPGQAAEVIEKIDLLDEEATFIQGNTVTFKKKVAHRANLTGIKYNATIFGITHTPAFPVTRNATEATADSTLNAVPTAVLVATSPDDDTSDSSDAFADFKISLVSGLTFAEAGVDTVIVKIRKAGGGTDDDPNDNRVRQVPFALEVDDLGLTSVTKRVRNLKFARRYEVPRVLSVRAGTNVRSAPLNISFRAGLGLLDPAGLTVTGTAVPNKKRDAIVTVNLTQTNPPVFVKEALILQDQLDGQGFVEVKAVNLKNKNRFQKASTQIAQPQVFKRKVHTPAGVAGIKYKIVIVAVGELTKESAEFTQAATSAEAPTDLPSVPTPADIISNDINLDRTQNSAKVVFRLYADWSKTKTFAQVMADSAKIILADPGDPAGKERYPFASAIPDPAATFVDLEAPSLVSGKLYMWRKNITKRNGIPAKSQESDVAFIAGGPKGTVGSPGLPELSDLSVTLEQVMDENVPPKADSRSMEYTLGLTQSKTQAGTGTMAVVNGQLTAVVTSTAQLRVGYDVRTGLLTRKVVSIIDATSILVDVAWTATTTLTWTFTPPIVLIKRIVPFIVRNGIAKKRRGDRILDEPFDDNGVSLFTPGVKRITDDINTPKKTNFFVRVRIIAVGDNFVDVNSLPAQSAQEKAFEDNGAPTSLGGSQLSRIRWSEAGHLRATFKLNASNPNAAMGTNGNLNTHVTNKMLFAFLVSGSGTWLWHPIERTSLFLGASLIDITSAPQQPFLVDVGKQTSLSLSNKVPKNQNQGGNQIDTSLALYNILSTNFSFINCSLFVFNQFGEILTGTLFGIAGNLQTTPSGSPNTGFAVDENTL